jgi:hypothetical protein
VHRVRLEWPFPSASQRTTESSDYAYWIHWEMKRRLRSQNVNYGHSDFEVISSVLTERMFLRIFRMLRDSFHRPISILADRHASFASGKISPESKLSITLRFIDGGSYIDIAWAHCVAHSTFYACVWETVSAIMASPEVGSVAPWNGES